MRLGPCLQCRADDWTGRCPHFPRLGLLPRVKLTTTEQLRAALEQGRKDAAAFRNAYCQPRWPRV